MAAVLVHGYVRKIENELNKIIPIDIYGICCDFYFTKILFYLSDNGVSYHYDTRFCAIDLYHKRKWKVSINDLNGYERTISCAGMCHTKNLYLPASIKTGINYTSNQNNIMFKCGGLIENDNLDYCCALIFDANEFMYKQDKDNTINGNKWELPSLPMKLSSNFLLYSEIRKELWSIGGTFGEEIDSIYKLSFDDQELDLMDLSDDEQWKWNKNITDWRVKLPTPMSGVCAEIIDDNYDSNKLCVIGGEGDNQNGDGLYILNINNNKWVKGKFKNNCCSDSGIYYDKLKELLYVAGGYCLNEGIASKSVECYDIEKNIWTELANTNKGHDMKPLIWNNNSLLFIASISANCVEYIDLRENNKGWIVKENNLSDTFESPFLDDVCKCRFVGIQL